MYQLGLPLYNPRDRGRLNALRNIVAAVSDELRQQQSVAQGIVDFTVNDLPRILRNNTPLPLLASDTQNPQRISPYDFEILDLIQMLNRPDVFSGVRELVDHLDIQTLRASLEGAELIGIDESIVETPLPHSTLAYLKSVAFRMYRRDDGTIDEAAGPILDEMRMQLRDDESFESEIKLLGYIRNNFVAYVSALTALSFGRQPFVVLHGPLVRAIGGFSQLTFDYRTAHKLLNINLSDAGEFQPPVAGVTPVQGDVFTTYNLSFNTDEIVDGDRNLHRFNDFCLRSCGRRCATNKVFPDRAVPPDRQRVTQKMVTERDYPGFCLYFWVLRSLVDLSRLRRLTITSAVEDVSAATEMTRLVLPSLFATPQALQQINSSSLQAALRATHINYPTQPHQRPGLYKQVKSTIEQLRLSDSNIFSYLLAEGQYTTPVQIYRYRTRNTYSQVLNDEGLGIRNEFERILEALFPEQIQNSTHPGYRVLMSYVRTSPLREPIRVEYFDLPHLTPPERVIGPVYLLSLPYQEYGMPVILYYADKLARTPTRLVRTIIEREYLDLVLQNRFSDPVSIMRVLGRLTRGYLQRDGLQ